MACSTSTTRLPALNKVQRVVLMAPMPSFGETTLPANPRNSQGPFGSTYIRCGPRSASHAPIVTRNRERHVADNISIEPWATKCGSAERCP